MPKTSAPKDGWWPAPVSRKAYPGMDIPVDDELLRNGKPIAAVMSFDDQGPYYGIAVLPEGPTIRSGALESLPAARDWCERLAGVKPRNERDTRRVEQEMGRCQ